VRQRSIRARLTAWNAAVIAGASLVFAAGVYAFVREGLYEEMDRQLGEESSAADGRLRASASGSVGSEGVGMMAYSTHRSRLEVWDLRERLLLAEGLAEPVLPPPSGDGPRVAATIRDADRHFRVLTSMSELGDEPVVVRVVRSEDEMRHELRELLAAVILGWPAVVLLAWMGGHFLATRALAPVAQMTAHAKTLTAERLSERLPLENPDDELGQLATVFNETLARLERSFDSLRRFTADAAHELRTPLTALRSVGEVALQGTGVEKVDRRVVESMLEEVQRLTNLVDALLVLSRADSGRVEVHKRIQDLSVVARDLADHLEPLANEKNQRIVVSAEEPVLSSIDEQLVRQALLNILHNAIKYSPVGSNVDIFVRRTGDSAIVEVVDHGIGIEAAHKELIFERFYRVDGARSRETGGTGLGLSIALWAIQVNDGAIEVESALGRGSRFTLRFPAARADAL
jgi:heavy metal sensor kinase